MQSLPKKPGVESNPTFKKSKLYNSRQIRTQITDDAFTNPPKGATLSQQLRKMLNNGSLIPNKLQIPDYLATREFEIKALDSAMIKSKTSGASRVFQALPRSLRRRTASHNVRRIPKRMRRKALREMGLKVGDTELGTKGVSVTGKPVKKKIGRGRSRWEIIRKIKLLKYAGKWKLKGRLPNSEYISINQINLRKRLKLLKKDLDKLNENPTADLNTEHINDSVKQESIKLAKLPETINNSLGHYDNTSVNRLAKITKVSCIKYATRQKNFKWTPTHIWHSKRAKMMKRWNWTLALEPTQRCFRSISRSSRVKGAVAVDTSYIGSLVINIIDKQKELEVFQYIEKLTQNKINITRCIKKGLAWEGCIYLKDNIDPLGKATLVITKSESVSHILLRAHPSIYTTIFNDLLGNFDEVEGITIHDCNYSLGSFDLTGPKTVSALQSIFYNDVKSESFNKFMNLHRLSDLGVVPNGTVFTFDVRDPRFKTKSSTPTNPKLSYDEQLDLIISLKKNTINPKLLSPYDRTNMYHNQLSLKELGKRRENHPGELIPVKEKDASIGVMLIKSFNSWTVILPWFWVLPFWHTLMHVPHVQFGGFKQLEQLRLERGLLGWSDMIFTDAGYVQSQIEKDENERKWKKRPTSKRVEYSKLRIHDESLGELLSPFGLDWRGLQTLRTVVSVFEKKIPVNGEKMNFVPKSVNDLPKTVGIIQRAEEQLKQTNQHSLLMKHKPITLSKLSETEVKEVTFNINNMTPLQITPVSFSCYNKGNISENARIYVIPQDQIEFWLQIGAGDKTNINSKIVRHAAVDSEQKPKLEDLVGLVTSATFNLTEGKSAGVGYIDASIPMHNRAFLVRNVASKSYSLVKLETIDVNL